MPRADRVSFLPGRPFAVVPATLNELHSLVLIADTGAERTVISQTVARRLGIDLSRPLRLQPLAGIGQSPPVPVVRLERVQVGVSAVGSLEAFVFDLPPVIRADGLLGLDFLSRFRVTFEFDTRLLVLRAPPGR